MALFERLELLPHPPMLGDLRVEAVPDLLHTLQLGRRRALLRFGDTHGPFGKAQQYWCHEAASSAAEQDPDL